LREKKLSTVNLYHLAKKVKSICRERKTYLLINDRVDVSLAVTADGVHLPTNSLPIPQTRKIIGEEALIGVSTHSLDEIKIAEDNACDFALFGPVFETESKKKYGPPQGLQKLNEVCRNSTIPVFAVGGIDSRNAPHCMDAGAHGIAVISAIMKSQNIPETVDNFRKSLGSL